jgi:hypothetical protein
MQVLYNFIALIKMNIVESLKFWNKLDVNVNRGIIARLLKLFSSISLIIDPPNTENTALSI